MHYDKSSKLEFPSNKYKRKQSWPGNNKLNWTEVFSMGLCGIRLKESKCLSWSSLTLIVVLVVVLVWMKTTGQR